MAFWAMLMFFATLATVAITALGVWLVKRTLDETIKAVRETGEATDAMREANEIARGAFLAQSRAYVSVDNVTISLLRPGEAPHVNIVYSNRGQTPAYKFSSRVTARIIPSSNAIELPRALKIRLGKAAPEIISIGPGQIQNKPAVITTFRDLDFTGIVAGHFTLIITGYATYRDHFGKLRRVLHSHYLHSEMPAVGDRLVLNTTVRGNRAN